MEVRVLTSNFYFIVISQRKLSRSLSSNEITAARDARMDIYTSSALINVPFAFRIHTRINAYIYVGDCNDVLSS